MEGRNSRPRIGVADRVGRSDLPAHRHSGERGRRRDARAARRSATSRRSPVRRLRHRSRDGRTVWEQVAREAMPHEGSHPDNGTWASSSASTDGEHVFAYFESQGLYAYDMSGKLVWQKDFGKKIDAQRVWRGHHARVCTATGLSSSGTIRARRSSSRWTRTRATRSGARRARKSTPGPRRSSSSTTAGRRSSRNGHEPPAQLRPRNRQDRLGIGRHHDESDSVAGGGRRDGVSDERLPRQQSEGDQARRSQRRHYRFWRDRLVARPRHAVRAVTASLQRHPVLSEDQLRACCRHSMRKPGSPTTRCSAWISCPRCSRLRLAPATASTSWTATGQRWCCGLARSTEVLARNSLDDGFDASPALVDDEMFMRGYRYLYCISGM